MSVHRSQVFRLYTQNTRRCRLKHILCTYIIIYIYTSLTFTRYIILYTNPTLRRLNHQVQDMVVGRYLRLTAAWLIGFPPSTIQAYGKSIWRCRLENDGHQQLLGFKFIYNIYIYIILYIYLDPGQQYSTQRWQWKTSMFNIAHRINHGHGNQNDSSRNIKSGFYLDRLSRNTLPETWFGIGSGPILGSPYVSIHITGGLDLLLQCSCCSHLISSVGSVRNFAGPGSKFEQTSCWFSIEPSRILAPNFQSHWVCPKIG